MNRWHKWWNTQNDIQRAGWTAVCLALLPVELLIKPGWGFLAFAACVILALAGMHVWLGRRFK